MCRVAVGRWETLQKAREDGKRQIRFLLLSAVCWETEENNCGGNLAAHACRFHQKFRFKSQNVAEPPRPPRGVLICCRFLQISARLRKFVIVRQVSRVPR